MTRELLHDLAFFGHYLHMHAGGRGGKQFVLSALHKNGGQLTQRELLELTNISPAAMSEVVAKLECEGLIAREPYEHDRRQVLVKLTKEGEVLAASKRQEREQFEKSAFACLDDGEKEELKALLDKLATHWRQLEEKEVKE